MQTRYPTERSLQITEGQAQRLEWRPLTTVAAALLHVVAHEELDLVGQPAQDRVVLLEERPRVPASELGRGPFSLGAAFGERAGSGRHFEGAGAAGFGMSGSAPGCGRGGRGALLLPRAAAFSARLRVQSAAEELLVGDGRQTELCELLVDHGAAALG